MQEVRKDQIYYSVGKQKEMNLKKSYVSLIYKMMYNKYIIYKLKKYCNQLVK